MLGDAKGANTQCSLMSVISLFGMVDVVESADERLWSTV